MPEQRYGLERLYLLPVFGSREDYAAATGVEPPKWDPSKPPKRWFDPAAAKSTRQNMTYDRVLAYTESGSIALGEDGKPVFEALTIRRADAAVVNIPPSRANVEGADVTPIPVPMRALADDEEFIPIFGGIWAIRIKGTQEEDRGFTEADRSLLVAIARKLGA